MIAYVIGYINDYIYVYYHLVNIFMVFISSVTMFFIPQRKPRYQWLIECYLDEVDKIDAHDEVLNYLRKDQSMKYFRRQKL